MTDRADEQGKTSEPIPKRFRITGALFALCVTFLPIGIRYGHLGQPGPELGPLYVNINVVFPISITVFSGEYTLNLVFAPLGILLPVVVAGHVWLVWQGFNVINSKTSPARFVHSLLLVTLIDSFISLPTFLVEWGRFPLPLILIFGILFVKRGIPPPSDDPFE